MRDYERPTLVEAGEFEQETTGSGGRNWEWLDAWGW